MAWPDAYAAKDERSARGDIEEGTVADEEATPMGSMTGAVSSSARGGGGGGGVFVALRGDLMLVVSARGTDGITILVFVGTRHKQRRRL